MAYRSLREFMARLEREGRLVRVREPVSPVLEITEIQTRLLAERGPAVLFENVARRQRYDMPVLVNLFGTVERVAWGMNREPQPAARARRDAGLPEPAGAARRLARGARDAAAAEDGAGDEAQDGRLGALPGGRAERRRHRPRPAADPDLLAGRARAADHLAAGGDARAASGKPAATAATSSTSASTGCR